MALEELQSLQTGQVIFLSRACRGRDILFVLIRCFLVSRCVFFFFFPLPPFCQGSQFSFSLQLHFLCSIASRSAALLCTNRLLDVNLVYLVSGTQSEVLPFSFHSVYRVHVQITDRSPLRLCSPKTWRVQVPTQTTWHLFLWLGFSRKSRLFAVSYLCFLGLNPSETTAIRDRIGQGIIIACFFFSLPRQSAQHLIVTDACELIYAEEDG